MTSDYVNLDETKSARVSWPVTRRLEVSRSEVAQLIAHAGGNLEEISSPASTADDLAQNKCEELSLSEYFRLLRKLTETSRDESLHMSMRRLAPGTTDFVIDTLSEAENLEDAMKRVARAYNLVHGGYYNQVEQRRGRLVYSINDKDFPYAFDVQSGASYAVMEGLLIFLNAMLSLAVGDSLTQHLRCVRSRRPVRMAPDGFLGFWESPVRCSAPVYALEYDHVAARLPICLKGSAAPNATAVYDALDLSIAERERTVPKNDVHTRVLEAIAAGVHNQSEVAQRLGFSVATMRRRLTEAGASFRALRSQTLNEMALSMLRQGRPVCEVAEALGYVDARSFSRAFLTWNGVTPTVFVARLGS
jgi:AraC-like DNA-binding protein